MQAGEQKGGRAMTESTGAVKTWQHVQCTETRVRPYCSLLQWKGLVFHKGGDKSRYI